MAYKISLVLPNVAEQNIFFTKAYGEDKLWVCFVADTAFYPKAKDVPPIRYVYPVSDYSNCNHGL